MPQGFIFGIAQFVSTRWKRRMRPKKTRDPDRDGHSQMHRS
jgi:hypothetical protein